MTTYRASERSVFEKLQEEISGEVANQYKLSLQTLLLVGRESKGDNGEVYKGTLHSRELFVPSLIMQEPVLST